MTYCCFGTLNSSADLAIRLQAEHKKMGLNSKHKEFPLYTTASTQLHHTQSPSTAVLISP